MDIFSVKSRQIYNIFINKSINYCINVSSISVSCYLHIIHIIDH